MKHVIVIGAPGTGATKQSALLATELAVPHITTAALLHLAIERATSASGGASTHPAQDYLDDALITDLLRARLNRSDTASGFVLDGIPRTLAQIDALDRLLEERGAALDAVVLLHADRATLGARLAAHLDTQNESTPDAVFERIADYDAAIEPLVQIYERRGILRAIGSAYPTDLVAQAVKASVLAVQHPRELHGVPIH